MTCQESEPIRFPVSPKQRYSRCCRQTLVASQATAFNLQDIDAELDFAAQRLLVDDLVPNVSISFLDQVHAVKAFVVLGIAFLLFFVSVDFC